MTKKHFWQSSSNWGFLGGAAFFAVNLIGWAFKLEASIPWLYEGLMFVVTCALIVYTGKRNAGVAGGAGYGYGEAIGFVLAMMAFAGVVYGVGRFLMINFIAPEYYGELYEHTFAIVKDETMRGTMLRMLHNPFVLIFASIMEMVFKGGFLGLVLCAVVVKKTGGKESSITEGEQDAER